MTKQYVQCRLDAIETLFRDVLSKARKASEIFPARNPKVELIRSYK